MLLTATPIAGLVIIEPRVFRDERGMFLESWNRAAFARAGIDVDFVQDNHSRSARGVLRGLHYQQPNPQGKLVRVIHGRAWVVAVDLRRGPGSFGQSFGLELTGSDMRMLWVPPGFAHGFLSLEDGTDFLYKCSAYHDPGNEHCLQWDDPELAIDWPLAGSAPLLSARDRAGTPLRAAEPFA